MKIEREHFEYLERIEEAVRDFTRQWRSLSADLSKYSDVYMECKQAETLAKLYKLVGETRLADSIIREHSKGDDDRGDMHYTGTDGTFVHPFDPENAR